MPSNHFIFCHPLLPPSTVPSIRVFSNKSVLWIRWPKYWSFSFSISPSNEYSGLISIRMDWLDEVTWGPVKEMQTLHIPWSSSATLPLNHYKTLHQISHGWVDTAFKGVSPLCPPLSGKATTLFFSMSYKTLFSEIWFSTEAKFLASKVVSCTLLENLLWKEEAWFYSHLSSFH